jgi:hypothetical protein
MRAAKLSAGPAGISWSAPQAASSTTAVGMVKSARAAA